MNANDVQRYVRYEAGGEVSYGLLEGESIRQLQGDLFENPTPTGNTVTLSQAKLLVPVDPMRVQKVIGIAGNYNNPAGEKRVIPHPRWFAKMPTSLNAHEADVDLPPNNYNFNFEGELVLVIGRKGHFLSEEEAADYVFGVTVGNDWSENGWYGERQATNEPSRLLSKSMDTWACLYHTIYRGLDYSDLQIEIRLNGERAAIGRTRDMVNSVPRLLSYISHYMTLMPGDIIYTGTVAPPSLPGIRRQMQDGDVVEVEIENIGCLRNKVVAMTGKGAEGIMAFEAVKV